MAKIRIKTDFIVRWGILTRGEAISLEGRDLRLEMNTPAHTSVEIPFSIEGNVLVIRVAPEVQTSVGTYSFTLWENHAKAGQTPLDKCSAFCLVSKSCKADMEDDNIEVEPVLELDTDDMSFAPISVGGGAIEIDAELSLESENAVQNKVVTEAINGVAQKAETAQNTADTNKKTLANLMGDGSGSIAYQIAQAIASIVANAPEAFDTLKEIADYIASDKTGAADLNNRISANATAISKETTRATTEEKNIRALAEANKQAIENLAGSGGGSGGGSVVIVVDPALSETSENPVQNAAITAGINEAEQNAKDYTDDQLKNYTKTEDLPEIPAMPDLSGYATKEELKNKVDKVAGKQLSTEDFTTLLKQKLDGLQNYDDTAITNALSDLQTAFNTLVSGDSTTAIKTFNEIIAFLSGIEDSESLDSIIASIEQQIAAKQDTIADLATIREGAGKGATAVQPSSLAKVATSGSYNDLSDKPTIPAAVTVDTTLSTTSTNPVQNKVVATGINAKYTKPSAGIPKSDLATAVQNSLGKAETALQTEQYKGTVTGVKINGTTNNPDANGLVDLGEISGGGESVQEVYVIDVNGEASEVYAGLKAAWDAGVKVYCVGSMGSAIPIIVEPTDDDAHTFMLMYSHIIPDEVYATINSAIAVMTIFQITAESVTILGNGQIPIGGSSGGSSGGSGAYAEVSHGTNDTTFELTPNTFHVWDEVASLTLTLGAETSGVANEYLFQFTSGATATTLTLPSDLVWANGEALAPEANKTYQVSIVNGYAVYIAFEQLPTNRITITNHNSSVTITSEYPVASDISVVMTYTDEDGTDRTESAPLYTGKSSLDWIVNYNVSGAISIESITPSVDASYKYIF